MKKNRIMIFPSSTEENEYLQTMGTAWHQAGFDVCFYSLSCFLKLLFCGNTYIYINWIENQTRERGFFGLILIVIFCLVLKLFRVRIIWVRHNKTSHNLKGRASLYLNKIAIYYMEWISFRVFCHGIKSAEENGDFYVPHPLYLIENKKVKTVDVGYLIFGRMTPYKGVENIIKEVGNVNLSVWGKFDSEYYDFVKSYVEKFSGDIDVRNEYIPNDELNLAISNCKAVLVGNDADSVIISGVVYRALELNAIVITTSRRLYEEVGSCRGFYYVSTWADIERIKLTDNRPKVQEINSSEAIVMSILNGVGYDSDD